jgi:hypothetical protein
MSVSQTYEIEDFAPPAPVGDAPGLIYQADHRADAERRLLVQFHYTMDLVVEEPEA